MAWSEQTLEALRGWLGPDTWDSRHPLDEGRFYAFIASVWNDEHGLWDEELAAERIANKIMELHSEKEEYAVKAADSRRSEGTLILSFLSLVSRNGKFGLLTLS